MISGRAGRLVAVRPVLRAAAAASALVLVLGACAGTGVPSQTWARQVCTSIASWYSALSAATATLDQETKNGKDLPVLRTDLVGYLGRAVSATDTLVAQLDRAGIPDVSDGKALVGRLRTQLVTARQVYADAQTRAKILPVTDPAQFEQGVRDLQAGVRTSLQQVQQSFGMFTGSGGGAELRHAFSSEPACRAAKLA